MQQASSNFDLVVCADDYALTPHTCEAIIKLADLGSITATSVMTLSPILPVWGPQAAKMKTNIDVGLHLDFTSDFALEQGLGSTLGQLMISSIVGNLSQHKVMGHIQRQLDLFEQHIGSVPDHIDGHQHVHQFPVIREALMEIIVKRYHPNIRPWLRVSRVISGRWSLKNEVINAMGASSIVNLAQRYDVAHSQVLLGTYNFSGDSKKYWELLNEWLKSIPTGSVLMCHPSTDSDISVPFSKARSQEMKILCDSDFQKLMHTRGVRLIRGKQLFRILNIKT